MEKNEIWKSIPSVPGYEASNFGRIRRVAPSIGNNGCVRKNKEFLRPRPTGRYGHLTVTVSISGIRKDYLVHRLVADAFLGKGRKGLDCVLHRDDDPTNNTPINLFRGNRTINSIDKVLKNRQAKGENVGGSKLSEADIFLMRKRTISGSSQRDLAVEFGISQGNVSSIVNRKTWGHLK